MKMKMNKAMTLALGDMKEDILSQRAEKNINPKHHHMDNYVIGTSSLRTKEVRQLNKELFNELKLK